ncbi:unnamed protein product [Bursaphelenchus xylophilus]|uniref:(pine wood nematode) hypothetical protein n=1 Tax=Bursaphelenchus xylophilus TaxID=6326 RepID=A0A1I7RSS9_BURXY|nr:unnamed protein product [Bursaphelenchus xylophilus]CAG9122814.1 unnamed protein product [Bursaphelenchus xylophilus]
MQCASLVFFDLETPGLIQELDKNDPRRAPRVRPGDNQRSVQQIFDLYDQADQTKETKIPKIMELSMVALPREDFFRCITQVAEQHKDGKKDFRLERVACPIITLQCNPGLSEAQWEQYDKRGQYKFTNLLREDVANKLTFRQNWPIIRNFLDVLPAPIALIAHNGLNFDFRILLNELKRNDLMTSQIFKEKVVFADTLLAFQSIEKAHHAVVRTVTESIDWSRVRPHSPEEMQVDDSQQEAPTSSMFQGNEGEGDNENTRLNASTNSIRSGLEVLDEFLDPDFSDATPTASILKRPAAHQLGLLTPNKRPPPPINPCKTAPPKFNLQRGFFEKCARNNPLRFMKHTEWSPAKVHRIRDDFFIKHADGSWSFHTQNAEKYFVENGRFKLQQIYKDVFRADYKAHMAQEDCIALLQVCSAYGKDFLNYIDTFAMPLRQYDPISN